MGPGNLKLSESCHRNADGGHSQALLDRPSALLTPAAACNLAHSENRTSLFRAWKKKKRPRRMKRTWRTPERSGPTPGVKGERARSPRLLSPFVIWCPRRRGPSGLAARPLSAWTPSLWSGITRGTWGARPPMKMTRKARTTAHCQVTARVSGALDVDPLGYVFSTLATRPTLDGPESSSWPTQPSVASCVPAHFD